MIIACTLGNNLGGRAMKTTLFLIVLSLAITVQAATLPSGRIFENFDLTDYVLRMEFSKATPYSKNYRTTVTGGPLPLISIFRDILQKQNEPNLVTNVPTFYFPTPTDRLAESVVVRKESIPVTRAFASILNGLGYNQTVRKRTTSISRK